MDQKILFDALEKFPETIEKVDNLADAVSMNNKTTTENVASISRAVNGQEKRLTNIETKLTTLERTVNSASTNMQKEVTVNYPSIPEVKIQHKDITVHAEHTDAEINTVANKVAEKVFQKKPKKAATEVVAAVFIFFELLIAVLWTAKTDNDYRAWMDRAINVGVTAGDMHPGDRGISVKEEFNKGRKARKAKKAEIEALEDKYDKQWKNNSRILKDVISTAIQADVVVLDYSLADVDSTSYNALVKIRPAEKEDEFRAHICKNGDIYITPDKDINTVQEADKYAKRKSWTYVGNRLKEE